MVTARVWLVAPIVLVSLVAGTGRGRSLLNRPTTPVESTNNVSCFDTSPHKSLRSLEPAGERI